MINGAILEALGHPRERGGLGFRGNKLPQGHREHPLWKTVMRQCAPPVLGGWSQGLTPMERYMYLPIRLAGFGIAPESASRRFAQPNSLVSLMPRLLPSRHQRREVLVPPELPNSQNPQSVESIGVTDENIPFHGFDFCDTSCPPVQRNNINHS